MKKYSNLVTILINRDGDTPEEAHERILETKRQIEERVSNGELYVDDIIADNLGLEPDYIFDILDY